MNDYTSYRKEFSDGLSVNPVIYLTINGEYIEAISLDNLNNLPAIIKAERSDEE